MMGPVFKPAAELMRTLIDKEENAQLDRVRVQMKYVSPLERYTGRY